MTTNRLAVFRLLAGPGRRAKNQLQASLAKRRLRQSLAPRGGRLTWELPLGAVVPRRRLPQSE
ncbi:MAG: hypothetical protein AAGJ46_11325 [Planctomycetota bacterium]